MMRVMKKKFIFIIILFLVVSSTIAYLYSSDSFQNIFVAASYKVTVVETFESPTNWKPGDTTPKTATLKNEGTVPIKVRVKLDEVWKDSNNQDLPLQHNDENVAIINFSNEDDYIYKDGYYYYDLALNPGETTSSIIESVTFNPNYSGTITCVENDDSTHTCSSSDEGYEGGTYKLTLTIEGVQEDYYVQAWGLSGVVQHQYLYDVLKNEAESNGLAREYTGEHHDSFTEDPSKKIYHWYAENDTEGTVVKNKNNVIFAGHCWQMIRTTDTGGVKMIYNGNVKNNNTCDEKKYYYPGYYSSSFFNLSSAYWYGTDYEYDFNLHKFKLSGIKEQLTWNDSTYDNIIGKYTCKSTNEDGTCSELYLVESYYSSTSATVIKLSYHLSSNDIGFLSFSSSLSLSSVSYMYGDNYRLGSLFSSVESQKYNYSKELFNSASLSTSYWYADSIDYNNINSNKYTLINPYKVSSYNELANLVGKYTFRNNTDDYSSSTVYYIVGVDGSTMYYKDISSGRMLSNYEPIIIGSSIIDNGNYTYTLDDTESISLLDWYENYNEYNNKYLCSAVGNITCNSPDYIIGTTNSNYNYVGLNKKILISKSRDGAHLVDTLLVRIDQLINDDLSDYKYTCGTSANNCTESNLRMIIKYTDVGYNYVSNRYFGSSVTWDGTNYTLNDTVGIEKYNSLTDISSHRIFCLSTGSKVCSSIGYIYAFNEHKHIYYVSLTDGVTDIEEALDNMLKKNTNNSMIKLAIDSWYKKNILDYDNYLEDTIFCNNRKINNIGGWSSDADIYNSRMLFEKNQSVNLDCPNDTDQFSIYNNKAKLTYKIGLPSLPELNLLNNKMIREPGYYYSLTPASFFDNNASVFYVSSNGAISLQQPNILESVKPVISIKPGIEYESGDGSMANPYIVKMD